MTVRVLDIDAVLFHDSALIFAGVAQLVEHFLAKEDVASSSLVTRFPFFGANDFTFARCYGGL